MYKARTFIHNIPQKPLNIELLINTLTINHLLSQS